LARAVWRRRSTPSPRLTPIRIARIAGGKGAYARARGCFLAAAIATAIASDAERPVDREAVVGPSAASALVMRYSSFSALHTLGSIRTPTRSSVALIGVEGVGMSGTGV